MYKLNDIVTWESQSGSYSKIKTGSIVQIVQAGERPSRVAFPDLYSSGCGFGRKGISYVVKVGNKHYWPRTCHLKKRMKNAS